MQNTILNFVAQWHNWSYGLLFMAMFFDANLMILAATFLITVKVLNPYLLAAIIVVGAYSEQLVWYSVGRYMGNKEFLSRWANRLVGRYDRHLTGRMLHSLVVTKFIYGVHRATLLRLGMLKVDFKIFALSSLKAVAVWLFIVAAVGFSFSQSYKLLNQYINYGGYVLLGFLILIFGTQYFISRRLEKDL